MIDLSRVCQSCLQSHPAYRPVGKSVARVYECPSCGHERPPSPVQLRRVWSCYKMVRKLAGQTSEKTGIEPAYCEDHAHTAITRAAQRFSNRNRTKFSTYAYSCCQISLSRWAQGDSPGGVSLRVGLISTADDDEPREEPDRATDHTTATATAEQLERVRSCLTPDEYATIEAYAAGDIDATEAESALAKARAAILTAKLK